MNKLYYGDNLTVLRGFPDECVDLIYLDPPFNSKRNYNVIFRDAKDHESMDQKLVFKDTWSNVEVPDMLYEIAQRNEKLYTFLNTLHDLNLDNSTVGYLTTMGIRLIELHRILKPTGSLYLHCDPTMSHYLKIVLDMIFSKKGFRNEIIWDYSFRMMDLPRFYNRKHDVILFYAKGRHNVFNMPKTEWTREEIIQTRKQKIITDENGVEWIWMPGGKGRSKNKLKKIEDIIKEGKAVSDIWRIPIITSSSKERLGYPTQKPLKLLERIVITSSNNNDIVLDPFCGCGTALDAAEGLKRKWIGIDITPIAIALIEKRLKDRYGNALSPYEVHGFPTTIESARQLAAQNKYEFQDWVIEYLLGGVSNPKKTGDSGFDGYSFFKVEKEVIKVIYEVKGGGITKPMFTYFYNAIEQQKAAVGIFVTLEEPTKGMIEYANSCGFFMPEIWGNQYHRLQIITVEELLSGINPQIPTMLPTHYKSAKQKDQEVDQTKIF